MGHDGGCGLRCVETDALGVHGGHGDVDGAIVHDELSVDFLFGVRVGLHLQGVACNAAEGDGSAVHLEVFTHVDAVGCRLGDGDGARGLLQEEVFIGSEGVACVAGDGE